MAQKEPSIKTMWKWTCDGIAKATDGCKVEPDGHCPHGKPSWLIELGYLYCPHALMGQGARK